jgi:carboxypeptidase PM20D1
MVHALNRIAAYETPLRPAPAVVRLFAAVAALQPFPTSFVLRHVDNPIVQRVFRRRLTERPFVNALLRSTISLTTIHGGYKTNVIPAEVDATLDCRVTVGDSGAALKRALEQVVDDPRVTIELLDDEAANESLPDPELMSAVSAVASHEFPGSLVLPMMSSGVTDSAAFRRHNVPAFGFNPIVLTEAELDSAHGIDERISLERFRAAVRSYYTVVTKLAAAE